MLPLGHIGITVFLASLLHIPTIPVLVGSIAPDIVDKILFIFKIAPCGRFFAHSVFFGPILAVITMIVTHRKSTGIAVLFGCYMHLLEDVRQFLPWFFPLVQYTFYCPPFLILRPDLIDMIFESIGALSIPIVFALKPKLKFKVLKWKV